MLYMGCILGKEFQDSPGQVVLKNQWEARGGEERTALGRTQRPQRRNLDSVWRHGGT